MCKSLFVLLLTSAFSLSVLAAGPESASNPQPLTNKSYSCWAKDYENLYFAGGTYSHYSSAQSSALKSCRQGSLAPETCRVVECKKMIHF